MFDYAKETNRQSRNLGPALVRMVSTGVFMKPGSGKTLLGTDLTAWSAHAGSTSEYTDAEILAANWLTTSGATWAMGDFNNDGAVNDIDAALLAANWQSGLGTSVSTPEPSTFTLLGIGVIALLASAWRRHYNS